MIERAFAEFAAARGDTLRLTDRFTQPQLDFSPGPGRWSVGEVLDHLLRAEDLYRGEIGRLVELARTGQRPYLRRTFDDVNVAPFFMPDVMLPLFDLPFSIMNRFIPDAVRDWAVQHPLVPIRNPSVATPQPRRLGVELRDELVSSLERTRSLLMTNVDLDYTQMVSEHPLMGPANVPQILSFLSRHERRHHAQINRVISDSRFPAR